VIDPARQLRAQSSARSMLLPIVLWRCRGTFGGRVTGDFKRQFDARVADAILIKAGIANRLTGTFMSRYCAARSTRPPRDHDALIVKRARRQCVGRTSHPSRRFFCVTAST